MDDPYIKVIQATGYPPHTEFVDELMTQCCFADFMWFDNKIDIGRCSECKELTHPATDNDVLEYKNELKGD